MAFISFGAIEFNHMDILINAINRMLFCLNSTIVSKFTPVVIKAGAVLLFGIEIYMTLMSIF